MLIIKNRIYEMIKISLIVNSGQELLFDLQYFKRTIQQL